MSRTTWLRPLRPCAARGGRGAPPRRRAGPSGGRRSRGGGSRPRREAGYRQLMRALAAAGERAEALRVWERCRTTLVEELGVDPSPETEAVYLARSSAWPRQSRTVPDAALPSGVVTFLLTDIVESSALWETRPDAMASALERHDALVAEVVAAHGGTLLKSKLEGDATVSVFARATSGARPPRRGARGARRARRGPRTRAPRLRMAMHTGEAFERGGDYFGPALNRAARLRALGAGGQVLLSQAVAELVRDHLPDGCGSSTAATATCAACRGARTSPS